MKTHISSWAGAACALALWAPCAAQSPLCTINPFQGGNGLSGNAIVFFDLNVTTPVFVNSIDTNSYSAASTPITVQIYTTPGTWVGNNSNPAAWTLVAQDAGGVLAAGRENVTAVPLAAPWALGAGSIGVAIVTDGGHSYTNGDGTNQNFSTNEMSISLGAATSYTTTPFTSTGLNNPRVWNGCLHYIPQTGLYPDFTASTGSGTSPLNVTFTDATFTSDPNGISSWAWDFDNDGTVDSTIQNPTHVYTTGGTFTVSLTVTDATHGTATETKPNLIVVDPISASFTATPTTGAVPLTVTFTDTTVGNPIGWNWDFDNDGTVDSTLQNPTHTYTTAGRFSVSLAATNGANLDSVTETDLILAVGGTNNTLSPSILEFQFNEPRGSAVNNTASTTLAPAHGVAGDQTGAPNDAWQADAGRTLWMGNDAGTGCLGMDPTSPYTRIDTGWTIDIVGSHTVALWTRATGSASASYAFGSSTGSARAYHSGSYLSLRNWGNLGFVDSATDPDSLTGWNHWALVVDDTTGTAQWYLNGVADGNAVSFTPGTFTFQAGNLIIGSYGTTTSFFSRYFDIDDFRVYGAALTPTQIQQAMASENPTTGTFGSGCAGAAGIPQVTTSGGAPSVLGNPTFAVEMTNMEPGRPAALNLGLHARGALLPYDLSFIPGLGGCSIEVMPDLVDLPIANTTGSATLPFPLPPLPALATLHVYGQLVVLGSSAGAVSPGIDVNFK